MLKDIQTRMLVILKPGDYDIWLDSGMTAPTKIIDMLKTFDAPNAFVSGEVNCE